MSKSIGGGLPLSLVLLKPELDQWKPGEHTGTFRGNNLAFVSATKLLEYWKTDTLARAIEYKSGLITERLTAIAEKYPELQATVRGRGMILGMHIPGHGFCRELSAEAFDQGLIIELAGAEDDVLKLLPPLVIEDEVLNEGLDIIDSAVSAVLQKRENIVKGLAE